MHGLYAQNLWLVANDELDIYPGGQSLFGCVGDEDYYEPVLSVGEGQFVFYDPDTQISIDEAYISTNGVPNNWAVAQVCEGELRHGAFGANGYYACGIIAATADNSNCGQPEIIDVWFDCPVDCGESMSITIEWDNYEVRSKFPHNRRASENYSFNVPCPKCPGDCPDESIDCGELVAEFIDTVKNKHGYDETYGVLGPRVSKQKTHTIKHPFTIHPKLGQTYRFCTAATATQCDCCGTFADIESIEIGGLALDLTHLKAPSMGEPQDIVKYFAAIQRLFDAKFKGKAYIYFAQGTGSCCPLVVEIETCLGAPTITSGPTDNPCGDPLKQLELCNTELGCTNECETPGVITCGNCDPDPIVEEYTCGFRVFIDPTKFECEDCGYPPITNYQYYAGAHLNVRIDKGAGRCKVERVQKATFPHNTGYQLAYMEYMSDVGGDKGRRYLPFEDRGRGFFGLPLKHGRHGQGKIDCNKNYCVAHVTGERTRTSATGARSFGHFSYKEYTTFAFENGIDTKPFFDILNGLIEGSGCCRIKGITCDVEGSDLATVDNDSIPGQIPATTPTTGTSGAGEDGTALNSKKYS